MIGIKQVSDELVNYCVELLETIKKQNQDLIDVTHSCTVNGLQSKNVIDYFSYEQRQELVQDLFHPETIRWLHLIEYNDGGYQKPHSHEHLEEWSFILYLNDSDGDTVLYFNDVDWHVHPVRGNIVYFKSDVLHEGLVSTKNKKILVGSISALKNRS